MIVKYMLYETVGIAPAVFVYIIFRNINIAICMRT